MSLLIRFLIILSFFCFFSSKAEILKIKNFTECTWDNKEGKPCLLINKPIPNTSQISSSGVKRYVVTAKEIMESGALDINDVIGIIPGLNLTQSGPLGQQTSLFTRGTGSNHTLVLLNGIPINDQSTTQGLHDFGVDFIQSIHQVEVYTGANSAHFGPNAIGGAVNFITTGDFKNSFDVGGIDGKNNFAKVNYSFITKNNWILNLKGGLVNAETNSAIEGGKEKDSVKNLSGNFNIEKWVSDNIRFRSNVYGRQTIAEYDNSSSVEEGYVGDNLMYATQLGFDHIKNNLKDYITFHFHKYDREYDENGIIDEYLSNASVTRAERQIQLNDNFSFGFGGEQKYNWGEFENRGSYSASTKGHTYNTGFFSNIGLRLLRDTTLNFYARSDDHKTTGLNNTHKVNITQVFNKFKIGANHSTGLRNPSLYELYGTDNYGYSGNLNLNPEKSETNEIFAEYNVIKNLSFSSTVFRSNIKNHIEYKNKQYVNDTTNTDLNQSGVEMALVWNDDIQKLSVSGISLSSKKTDGSSQLRRPEKTYGFSYNRSLNTELFGALQFNVKHQHYGKHWDTHSKNWSSILMDSTDIMDLSINKEIKGNNWSININNLLDESYQRPHGYMHEGRQIRLGFNKIY